MIRRILRSAQNSFQTRTLEAADCPRFFLTYIRFNNWKCCRTLLKKNIYIVTHKFILDSKAYTNESYLKAKK